MKEVLNKQPYDHEKDNEVARDFRRPEAPVEPNTEELLKGVKPGSPEERAVLKEVREYKDEMERQRRRLANQAIKDSGELFLPSDKAHEIHKQAYNKTYEHKLPKVS